MKRIYTPEQMARAYGIASDFSMNAAAAGAYSAIADVQSVGRSDEQCQPIDCHLATRACNAFLRYAPDDFWRVIAGMGLDEEAAYRKVIARFVYRNARRVERVGE